MWVVRDRQLYGVGYGGMLLEGLIEEFVGVGGAGFGGCAIARDEPGAGFSRNAVSSRHSKERVSVMCMIPGLGNAKEDRVSFRWGDGSEGRAVMRARLLNGRKVALREFQDGG